MAVITGTNWNAYDASTMTAREIYGRTLTALAEGNDKIVGLTADLEVSDGFQIEAAEFGTFIRSGEVLFFQQTQGYRRNGIAFLERNLSSFNDGT